MFFLQYEFQLEISNMQICERGLSEAKVADEYYLNSIDRCINSSQHMLSIKHLLGNCAQKRMLELLCYSTIVYRFGRILEDI